MKNTLLLLIFSIVFAFKHYAQNKTPNLVDKFKTADSVLIASHESLNLPSRVGGKSDERRQILKDGLPNRSIIKEMILLNEQYIDSLSLLLSPINDGDEVPRLSCFNPHHSVFIFKNGTCFYIDICFGCKNLVFSELIITDEISSMSYKDWDGLEHFFKRQGLRYGYDIK